MGQLCKGESFAALDDDGRRYRIVHWIEFVDLTDGEPGHPRLEPSGFECLRLEDGRIVDLLDGGRLEIAESGQLLSRIADASWTAPMIPRTGEREASGRDAVAYARQAREKPELAQEEPRWERSPGPRAATDAGVPGTQDTSLMALLHITLADGQYVFDGYRYDRLHDAAACARLQQSAPTPGQQGSPPADWCATATPCSSNISADTPPAMPARAFDHEIVANLSKEDSIGQRASRISGALAEDSGPGLANGTARAVRWLRGEMTTAPCPRALGALAYRRCGAGLAESTHG